MADDRTDRAVVVLERDRTTRELIAAAVPQSQGIVWHEDAAALLAAGVPPATVCMIVSLAGTGPEDPVPLIRDLRDAGVRQPMLMLSHDGDIQRVARAMRAGACHAIIVPCPLASLRTAIADVAATGGLRGPDPPQAVAQARLAALSPREAAVLAGIAEGRPNKGIAAMLGLSPRTVEAHRARMLARLGVRSPGEAVRIAVAGGLVP